MVSGDAWGNRRYIDGMDEKPDELDEIDESLGKHQTDGGSPLRISIREAPLPPAKRNILLDRRILR
jgi:hypothetical protein